MSSQQSPGVLVLCTGNSCRSQMAEAFLRQHGGDRFEVYSAGTEPAGEIHPLVHTVMAERGLDLSRHYPKDCRDFLGTIAVHTLIIVCDGAARSCPTVWPGVTQRLIWPTDDPAAFAGDGEQTLAEFRRVRDELEGRVLEFLESLVAAKTQPPVEAPSR
jgi:arsenate reductase